MDAIIVDELRKKYGDNDALRGVTFSVKKGDFFGYLGPNGAGKTTTINILTGLTKKTSGSIKVLGKDLDEDHTEIKKMFGIVPQEFNFDPFLSNFQTLWLQSGYYGIPVKEGKKKAEELLKQFQIWDKKDLNFRTLSGGMKRRLLIARALVHDPPIMILDEPTAGVDVELRYWLWDYLRSLNEKGKTIILTTHYLEEAEQLCKTIAIINKGQIQVHDKTLNLLEKGKKKLEHLYLEVTK